MMDRPEIEATAKPLTAITIDPDSCRVELIQVEADEVGDVLRSTLTETIDFESGNCLVIDDGSPTEDHPSRFHFEGDALQRPYFGPVLVLGSVNGNWASTTMPVDEIRSRVVWEHWNPALQRYGEPALELA